MKIIIVFLLLLIEVSHKNWDIRLRNVGVQKIDGGAMNHMVFKYNYMTTFINARSYTVNV